MILTFNTVHRRRREQQRPSIPTVVFVAGYLVLWTAYAAGATLAQWGLHTVALLTSTMATTSTIGGGLLIAAGVFQWTPIKRICLANCRSPLSFLMTRWREGPWGALSMGVAHGLYCVGCCWMLMALLFVAGVMNLAWVAVIAVFVLLEKVLPGGDLISRLAGIALVAAGLLLITGAWGSDSWPDLLR
jgi:predicted metal-binding membrane protein